MFREFDRPGQEKPDASKVVPLDTRQFAQIGKPVHGSGDDLVLMHDIQNDRIDLKARLHNSLLDKLNLAVIEKVEEETLRGEIGRHVTELLRAEGRAMRSEEVKQLVEELMHEVLGLGPLEPLLADPTINDILVNGHTQIFVERSGILEKTSARFRDERHLLRIIDKIVSRIGRRIDERQPWVDARLEDGSRVNAIIRPCALDGPALSIRKFSRVPLTMERLIKNEALNESAAKLLRGLVEAKMNVLISGGTGSGKTTMLNALSSYISPRERIVTIEDAAELQLQQEHVLRMETRPAGLDGTGAVVQRDLVRNALRMRPDRIIIGEVRGSEAFDMLQAMNTGHDGSMTTVHANSPRDALSRVEQMVQMGGLELPHAAIRATIASAIHFVLQLNRLSDGTRRVTSIAEITGMEGDIVTMQDIFVFKREGKDEAGNILGRFMPTGIRPKSSDALAAAGVDLSSIKFN
ncbi:CpaF family protein [Ruegeria arenilitoris]|uniref:Putative conjugal transfer protein/MT3759 n=1 Tax=Ruegeria arenilitoris TaxID=1173585 RepID=A0A238JVM9_9RHOB|nr:CpaF family protein [Ruegeria arenilitoris]SMX34655.1 Putative conjugal transfer protein/MT3759 [Ruegeria arenilitoris]